MKEFFESLLGSYKGRYKNKFIGTFFLFYLVLNWKKVAVIFFISDMSYRDFLFHWSDDASSVLVVMGCAFILSCLYLAVSPWLSYVVHVAQSKAIAEYKIQTIKNDIRIIEEKERLEAAKGELLQKERDNINMEVGNSEKNRDINVYNILKSKLTEQDLMNMYFGLEKDESISYEMFRKTKEFFHELSAAENDFLDKDISKAVVLMREKFLILLEDMKKHRGHSTNGYTYSPENIKQIVKDKDSTINSYRDFIRESKKCFSL